jgi:transposase-like protein
MSGDFKLGRKPVHDPAFKVAVARDYLTSSLGYGAIAQKYGLHSISTVRFFVKWYKKQNPNELDSAARASGKTQLKEDKPLQQANLKITALEMLIEEASKELGIDLVKKFGTRQSKK